MQRLAVMTFFCVILVQMLSSQPRQEFRISDFDEEHTQWIASALRSIQAVKVGMTRSELMTIFTTEGGLEFRRATTSRRTYVYRLCRYIKVDVTLAISNPDQDSPTDKIKEISKPYLEWTIVD